MSVDNERTLLLVSGYVREAESVMDTNDPTHIHIIPVSLIQVCYKFYLNQISKFIQYSSNPSYQENKFISLNINKCMIDNQNIIELGRSTKAIKQELIAMLDPTTTTITTRTTTTNTNTNTITLSKVTSPFVIYEIFHGLYQIHI